MMEPDTPRDLMKVLELYSGIGGMHYALKESCISAEVVAAVDINTVANEVYKHNFPNTCIYPKTIEGITSAEFNKFDFDMILMSPPCQPFTSICFLFDLQSKNGYLDLFLGCGDFLPSGETKQIGLGAQKDILDSRIKSFLYILDLLPSLIKLPKYILLENVKGFETSVARDKLIQTLKNCGYSYQEFLLSPTLLGIPNSRLRYFLLAKLQPDDFCFQTSSQVLEQFPDSDSVEVTSSSFSRVLSADGNKQEENKSNCSANEIISRGDETVLYKLETLGHVKRKQSQDNNSSIQMIQNFLEEQLEDPSPYFIPLKSLLRYALILDIVGPTCRRSVCFTKGYGCYMEGTGSVLKTASNVELPLVFLSFETLSEDEKLTQLAKLKLRYFTPREIANLHGFPPEFSFPEKISLKQRYRLLGNSLNIHVVAKLIKLMVD